MTVDEVDSISLTALINRSNYRTEFVYWLEVVTSGRDIEARRTGAAPLKEIGETGAIAVAGAAYSWSPIMSPATIGSPVISGDHAA